MYPYLYASTTIYSIFLSTRTHKYNKHKGKIFSFSFSKVIKNEIAKKISNLKVNKASQTF